MYVVVSGLATNFWQADFYPCCKISTHVALITQICFSFQEMQTQMVWCLFKNLKSKFQTSVKEIVVSLTTSYTLVQSVSTIDIILLRMYLKCSFDDTFLKGSCKYSPAVIIMSQ